MTSPTITILDLDHQEQSTLNELLVQLNNKMPRNLLRSAFYDGKNAIRAGINLPPYMRNIPIVLGWSAKAVDVLNRRCPLDGFAIPGLSANDLGITDIWNDNYLDIEAPQAAVSSLIHATAFLVTTEGDEQSGEPPVLITAKDALSATGRWNRRRRALDAFLSVIETDAHNMPVEMALYLDQRTVVMTRNAAGRWNVTRIPHDGPVPVEPLTYRPRLGRPFGSSRISRPVMSLHKGAIRTAIRSEVSAERYSVAQRVLLGADPSAFKNADGSIKPLFQAILDQVWAIPDDDDAENPRADVKEFSAGSQEPHMSQLRAQAQLFAGETSIPISSLGISTEANPASAEAYYASREDLIAEAEGTTDGWTPAWRRTMIRALQLLHGWSTIPEEVRRLQPKWRSPASPSRAAAADAAGKTLEKFPWLAESELGLELYGFDQSFIDRAMAQRAQQAPTPPVPADQP